MKTNLRDRILSCQKCGYFWYRRASKKTLPERCPKCKRTTWRLPDTFVIHEFATRKFYRLRFDDLKKIISKVRSQKL